MVIHQVIDFRSQHSQLVVSGYCAELAGDVQLLSELFLLLHLLPKEVLSEVLFEPFVHFNRRWERRVFVPADQRVPQQQGLGTFVYELLRVLQLSQ